MKLLVDIGNSRVKWAWLEGGELRNPGAAACAGADPYDVIRAAAAGAGAPVAIALVSVLGSPRTESLATRLARDLGARVTVATTEARAGGVRNAYLDHRQMGTDRWLAMVAAYGALRTAVCVVDAGTAVTIDAVAADGAHLGGLITPGPELMRHSLMQRTAGIRGAAERRLDVPAQAGRWGRDTESCIRLGAWRATACLVADCVKALRDGEGPGSVLVLTGGDAPALQSELSIPAEHRPLLVLEGLALRCPGD